MNAAWDFVLSIFTETWHWLGTWGWHGVAFSSYIIGFVILSILITRIFN